MLLLLPRVPVSLLLVWVAATSGESLSCHNHFSLELVQDGGEPQLLRVHCGNITDYDVLSGCRTDESVSRLEIRECPLHSHLTFSEIVILLGQSPSNITHFSFILKNSEGELNERHLQGLQNLKLLNITHNKLTSFPESLFRNSLLLETLDLSNNNLEYLPASLFSPLKSLTSLSLQNNNIKELRSELFTDVRLLNFLDLSNNEISSVQASLFSSLKVLKHLNMSGNKLETIHSTVFSDTGLIQTLDFSMNSLASLQPQTFDSLNRLKSLNLGQNQLTSLPDTIFRKCRSLVKLHLDHNELSEIHSSSFPSPSALAYIDLGFNNITTAEIKGICSYDKFPLLSLAQSDFGYIVSPSFPLDNQEKLKHIYLNNNNIKCIPGSFGNVYINLETLDLSGNVIEHITYTSVDFLSSRVSVNLQNNAITTMTFNDMRKTGELLEKKEVEVSLAGNPLVCDCFLYRFARLAQGLTFRGINNLFKLTVKDMDQVSCHKLGDPSAVTYLPEVDTEALTCQMNSNHSCDYFWRPHDTTIIANCSYLNLHHIPTLDIAQYANHTFNLTVDMTNNSISALPGIYNPTLSKLSTLILANNKLSTLNLSGLPPSLHTLDVRGNNLTALQPPVLEFLNRTGMTMSLGHNPWECNCDLLHLVNFLHVPSRKVLDFDDLQCEGGGEPLMSLNEHYLCPFFLQPMVLVTTISILVVLIIFAVLGTVSFYKYQQGIKVWLFTHRLCLWAITEDELDADKKYDAFISYSHKDEEFVNKVLVPGLESGEPKYRVCLHYRDWMPGEFIQNQIVRSVEASRRTLVVLSPNFIESVWGQLEFRAAHSQALHDGTNRIIVIIYGEIPPLKELDEKLRLYVSMKTYVRWGDAKFWEKLRYMMPHPQDMKQKQHSHRKRKDTDRLELCKSGSKQYMC